MQPTETQVQRSLAALRASPDAEGPHPDGHSLDDVPAEVLEGLDEPPEIRSDRLEEARLRMASGLEPSADDLAQRMVGRLVCDRLR